MVEKSNSLNASMKSSRKMEIFASEPMGEKLVTDLPGIGSVLGERLRKVGFDLAYTVFGQFLILKKDEKMFCDWLNMTCDANIKQSTDCYTGLKQYAESCL